MNSTSIEVYERRPLHKSMPDWHMGLSKLRETARSKRHNAFDLRNLSVQLRNETDVITRWDTYKTNESLKDRIFDVSVWRNELQNTLENLEHEILALQEEKINTERCMDALYIPLSVIQECLINRDMRRNSETTKDDLDTELKRELFIAESNKKHLQDVCCDAWEMLTELNRIKRRLQVEIDHKSNAIHIDKEQLNLTKDSPEISYKLDPFRTLPKSITEQQWLELTKDTYEIANNLRDKSKLMREILFRAREQAHNEMDAQRHIVEHALRKRIFDTQKARNELIWQRNKIKNMMEKAMAEIKNAEDALVAKVNVRKLVETRAENRNYRIDLELVRDRVSENLEDESRHVKQTMAMLQNKIDQLKTNYNSMEKTLFDIEKDLSDKENTLEIDCRNLEIRTPLNYECPITRNIALNRGVDVICPPCSHYDSNGN